MHYNFLNLPRLTCRDSMVSSFQVQSTYCSLKNWVKVFQLARRVVWQSYFVSLANPGNGKDKLAQSQHCLPIHLRGSSGPFKVNKVSAAAAHFFPCLYFQFFFGLHRKGAKIFLKMHRHFFDSFTLQKASWPPLLQSGRCQMCTWFVMCVCVWCDVMCVWCDLMWCDVYVCVCVCDVMW